VRLDVDDVAAQRESLVEGDLLIARLLGDAGVCAAGEVHGGPEVELDMRPVVEALQDLSVRRRKCPRQRRAAQDTEVVEVSSHGVDRVRVAVPVDRSIGRDRYNNRLCRDTGLRTERDLASD